MDGDQSNTNQTQPEYNAQSGIGGENQPITYGEESKIYEQQAGYNQQMNGGMPQQTGYNRQMNGGMPPQTGYNQQMNGGIPPQTGYNQQMNGGIPPQAYYNQPNYQGGYNNQPQHGPVSDVFCFILLTIMILQYLTSFIMMGNIFSSLNYNNIMDGSYIYNAYSGTNLLVMLFSYALSIGFIIFIVLDIIKIYKQHYKITGLILFAIFCNPGYYLWRAHILGRKKTGPIIYTVAVTLILIAYFVFIMYQIVMMMSLVWQSM